MENKLMYTITERFCWRLNRLGIKVLLEGNYPWIYIRYVNGKAVRERYMAEHGFTAFWAPTKPGQKMKFTDRRRVFMKIREMLGED